MTQFNNRISRDRLNGLPSQGSPPQEPKPSLISFNCEGGAIASLTDLPLILTEGQEF
ncbi:hypothetical protein H6F98_11380 [Microcoleus sp. FACHB-SPT15]|uniref:hypothetical protein n=1 Tax=Microcoleus sp. FACHB-SPT15 TaxID=2692830 RepID=UPI001781753E|nr:hypothetical protein [Microcoleus sp. FACHB-SPT15]MBD1806049.1 hypothetical protein [Microcoleus sp. FACHB-SPT15]